ncbi:MAG: rod shape-determining protein MreD [Bacteroidetes bacterium]|nr:rod shape-determining protein MreD [Bacteroidota bacterium]
MTIDIIKNIFRFFLLIAIQILVLNNIQLSGFLNPYLYVLFILMLPFETPKWLTMVLAFMIGLSVDIFSDSPGMHAAASTFMAFCRPMVLKIIQPRDGYEFTLSPTIAQMGVSWFLTYAVILIFLHHLVYFYIEIFRFNEFFAIFTRVILSSIFTLLLVIFSQLLFTKPKEASIR